MRTRLALVSLAVPSVFALYVAFRSPGPTFRAVADGTAVAPGWMTVVEDRGPGTRDRYRYALKDRAGKVFPLHASSFDDLELAVVSDTVIATRYDGSGSSGATYYSFYRLAPAGPVAIPAAETRDWGPDEPCRETATVQRPTSEAATVFGACAAPEWNDGNAVFHMPGFHCSRWQTGGCPSEHVVRWR